MKKKLEKNKDLQVQITDEDAKRFETNIRNLGLQLKERNNELVKKTLKMIRSRSQPKELQEALYSLTYSFMLDGGALLSSIPNKDDIKYGILNIRQRLIEEHDCKTAVELILVDELAAAYLRLMKYEKYVNILPENKDGGYTFNQLTINALKEARGQIEQAHRQITMALTQLKDIKQPALKVNVKAESAYFAQNQQVINEKPQNETPMETIKPK